MKFICVFIILFSSSVFAAEMANYQGYKKVNDKIFNSILKATKSHPELGYFIGEHFGVFGGDALLQLTGFYPSGISKGEMRNGEPNGISMMVYYFLFHHLSQKISLDCLSIDDPIVESNYQSHFLSLMKDLCISKNTTIVKEDQYFDFWVSFHSFNAPIEEFEEWMNYHRESVYKSQSEKLYAMALTALMNPYFMIQN